MRGSTRRRAALALALAVLASGCDGDGGGRGEPPPSGDRRWLAVLETAADPDDLDAATADLIERVGPAVVTSPAGCFEEGLEGSGIGAGEYVLGVAAESADDLAGLVARSGRRAVFSGEVTDTCHE